MVGNVITFYVIIFFSFFPVFPPPLSTFLEEGVKGFEANSEVFEEDAKNSFDIILDKTWSSVSNSSLSKTFALALVLLVVLVTWTPNPLNSAKSP